MHDHFAFQYLVGQSHWTERTYRRILQASRYSYPALITGPTGTGKELIARAIHAHSSRADQPLIPFRCGQVPGAFALTQLFGHAAGYGKFTRHAAMGCLGAAQGGTILLHEVGELDLATQDRLLPVLRDKLVRRVGANDTTATDVRVVATSSRDLGDAVRRGEFRFELLYSLNAISMKAIPLSERRADIGPLARHILARVTLEHGLSFRSLTPSALALLESYDWPGNVTEMEQELEQAVLATDGSVLDLEDFPDLFTAIQQQVVTPERMHFDDDQPVNQFESVPHLPTVAGSWPTLLHMEAEHLRATLRRTGQNVVVAAKLLGLEVAELQVMLARHRIQPTAQPTPIADKLG